MEESLKQKLKGQNKDIHISDMTNYQAMKDELEKNKIGLERANKKVDNELKDNTKKIKILTENNDTLHLIVETLTQNITYKDEEITELQEENHSLKSSFQHFKTKFFSMFHFLVDRILRNKDREKYMEFTKELYKHGAIDDDDMNMIQKDCQHYKIPKTIKV